MGEGIYVVDEHQRITFVNPAGVNMLGWSEREASDIDGFRRELIERLTRAARPE